MRNKFVLGTGMAVATFLMPVMWYLWLFPGSGNANFFYNQTLVYQLFHSLIIVGFVAGTMKRDKVVAEYWKIHLSA